MKPFLLPLTLILLSLCWSCEVSELSEPAQPDAVFAGSGLGDSVEPELDSSGDGEANYSSNSIIVNYPPGLSEQDKATIRSNNQVSSFEKCNCSSEDIELWQYDGPNGTIIIEDKLAQASSDIDPDGLDFNNFTSAVANLPNTQGAPAYEIGVDRINDGTGVKIAVLDSGIDYAHSSFPGHFLSPAYSENIEGMNFGWDYVNDDNDPYDDFGHGTVVSGVITSKIPQGTDYSILPIKIIDSRGKGNLFDALCATLLAIEQESNIINMSFSWSGASSSIFKKIISQNPSILFVTSAGNDNADNDAKPHFPSNYQFSNLLAISSLNLNASGLAQFSNYGRESVHFAARGEEVPSYLPNQGSGEFSGTSFAAPQVTAAAAILYSKGIYPEKLIDCIKDESFYLEGLHGKLIFPYWVDPSDIYGPCQ